MEKNKKRKDPKDPKEYMRITVDVMKKSIEERNNMLNILIIHKEQQVGILVCF